MLVGRVFIPNNETLVRDHSVRCLSQVYRLPSSVAMGRLVTGHRTLARTRDVDHASDYRNHYNNEIRLPSPRGLAPDVIRWWPQGGEYSLQSRLLG